MAIGDSSNAPALRIGYRERDATVERLRVAAGDGLITLEELESRMEAALAARTADEISVLVADLPEPATSAAKAASAEPLTLTASHSTIKRLGAWQVPEEITIEAQHAKCWIDLRTPTLPTGGVRFEVTARHSMIKVLVAGDADVDLTSLRCHHSQTSDRRARWLASEPGAPIVLTGDLQYSVVRIMRPGVGRRRFERARRLELTTR